MKKKILLSILLIVGIISCGIYSVNAEESEEYAWGDEVQIGEHDLKFKFNSVKIKVYSYNENLEKTYIENKDIDYEVNSPTTPSFKYGVKADGLTDNSTYVDTNLNITETKMNEIVTTFITNNSTYANQDLVFDVVLNYTWTKLPTYNHFYNTNLLNDKYSDGELSTLTLNTETSQVLNTAYYYSDDESEEESDEPEEDSEDSEEEEEPEVSSSTNPTATSILYYDTEFDSDYGNENIYNYAIFTNNNYKSENITGTFLEDDKSDISMLDVNDTKILFHDLDDEEITKMINARKSAYEEMDETETEESEEVVETPNTSLNASTLLIALSIILVITGCGVIGVVLKQKRQLEQ